jgi:hypothetical protein
MNIKDIIKEIVVDFHEKDFKEVIPREMQLPVNSGKIISVIGVRRSGKTYLLYDTVKTLLNSGVKLKSILYMNFEDERLNIKTSDLDTILQAYRELNPDLDLSTAYFMFDEIQNIDNWEKFVRRCYDSVTRNIFITGSNSKFLSKEIATSLRGRTISYEVYPLSFKEYTRFKKIDVENQSSRNKAKIINSFDEYLMSGGFPEAIFLSDELRTKTLQEYYNVMLYKDIIERYNISNTQVLRYFLERVLSNLGLPTSINKIYNELQSQNYKTTKNILYDIIDWAEAIYYVFRVYKFSTSIIDREKSEKKMYFIDNGLINSLTFRFSNNYGSLLENLIGIYLKKKYDDKLFYYKDNVECDFVAYNRNLPAELIQVSYDISHPDTLEREVRGLKAAASYFGMKNGTIITKETEKQIKSDGLTISIIPAYKYLLQ